MTMRSSYAVLGAGMLFVGFAVGIFIALHPAI
ncbi:conserved hypothetical protein [Caulobacter segnis ATCC 21756]|jgi:hypothetical protein|uniref:Uncharacterized protein n=1 Tax=Caulobacter segnis (strain ATCC 21756 / DSM 7131 / JCM 7823 / NBRC 15250 / LMG 17158 / TK0059) TaxID=509190 RepID=D5VL90_CAUST|nr:conserved hypothetical protein [Caulobacter segnis ATCC 21756]